MKLHLSIFFLLYSIFAFSQNSYINNLTNFTPRVSIVSEELFKATPVQYQSHPEFGILPYDAPCKNCYELIHERTNTTRKFILNNTNGNEFAVQTALGTLNYKGADNRFYEYNRKLSKVNSSTYVSENKSVVATFDLSNKRTKLTTVENAEISFNQVKLVFLSANSTVQDYGIANWSNYSIGEDGIRIIDAWPNIDIEMINTFHGVKTSYIIKQNLNLGVGQLLFIDNFSLPSDYNLSYSDPINHLGEVFILNENGTTVFQISEAFGMGALERKEDVTFFNYDINGSELSVIVESAFLDNSEIQYPLVIDPNVSSTNSLAQASIAGSMYNNSCNFDNSCNYTLNVASPINATINDITFSMSYSTYGLCWLYDGAMRIAYNGCISPNGVGFYWYCNTAGTGTCNGANISIYSDISSCIPAPACTPYNMPFTMQFFRSCWGATGCSNNCVQASTPFSVTVFGTNLQTLNNNPTGNGSLTISPGTCSGTTTLNPLAGNGVPSYTYSWSTGATTPTTTVPSFGSSPVTCTVTDACGVSRIATFTIICPLGVEYRFITANKIANRTVELAWETIEETDNDFFTILSSLNGIDFKELGVVQSKGKGNFNYSFIDNSKSSNIVYYRLLNTSLSGEKELSEIFKVDFNSSDFDIVIVPNPSNGEFHVNYTVPYSDEYTIQIVDAFGRTIVNKKEELKKGKSYLQFDLSAYKKGVFTITINNKTSTSKQRIVIQ